jgi:hypothetical protein
LSAILLSVIMLSVILPKAVAQYEPLVNTNKYLFKYLFRILLCFE